MHILCVIGSMVRQQVWMLLESAHSGGPCVAQVAGQQSGVNVVDKAQSAVNTVKIINALNEISDILKVNASSTLSGRFCRSLDYPYMLPFIQPLSRPSSYPAHSPI